MIIRTYGNLKQFKEFFYLKISKENDTGNLLKVNNVAYGPFGLLVFSRLSIIYSESNKYLS